MRQITFAGQAQASKSRCGRDISGRTPAQFEASLIISFQVFAAKHLAGCHFCQLSYSAVREKLGARNAIPKIPDKRDWMSRDVADDEYRGCPPKWQHGPAMPC